MNGWIERVALRNRVTGQPCASNDAYPNARPADPIASIPMKFDRSIIFLSRLGMNPPFMWHVFDWMFDRSIREMTSSNALFDINPPFMWHFFDWMFDRSIREMTSSNVQLNNDERMSMSKCQRFFFFTTVHCVTLSTNDNVHRNEQKSNSR